MGDNFPKILTIMSGVIILALKLKDSFSSMKEKQELKLDLEIYDLVKKTDFDLRNLQDEIKRKLDSDFTKKSGSLLSFVFGLVSFLGFGYWSYNIYMSNKDFNYWILLTLFLSVSGFLSMLSLDIGKNEKENEVFYRLVFVDKTNFILGLAFSLFGALTSIIVFLKDGLCYVFWIAIVVFLFGFFGFINRIKKSK